MLIGLDEVGRGAWAGPLVFAAVAIDRTLPFCSELNDSKKLSLKKRLLLNDLITQNYKCGIGIIEAELVDQLGLTEASRQACICALKELQLLQESNIKIIIDGNINYLSNTDYQENAKCIPKADSTIVSVMAASIIAKVKRDNMMIEYANQFPGYMLEKNVGYGTKQHIEAIKKLGVTKIHRHSYRPIKQLLSD